jgi:pimeloyl-ACP methyl ester carboxylesterase
MLKRQMTGVHQCGSFLHTVYCRRRLLSVLPARGRHQRPRFMRGYRMKTVATSITALLVATLALLGLAYTPGIPVETLASTYANADSRFLDVDGMKVHYRDEGQGPALLLIHGTSSSLHTWDAWTRTLKQNHRVIRFDLPAFGLTGPRADKDYSIAAYVELARKVLDRLEIAQAAVAGNSLGGDIAWRMALTHPERVSKLILVDAAGYPRAPEEMPFVIKLASTPVVQDIMPHLAPRFMYVQNVREVYHDTDRIDGTLIDRYRDLMLREGNRQAMVDRINMPFVDEHQRISSIRQPVLIQWGRHDRWIPATHAERFASDIPGAILKWYEAGHVPMEELPDATAKDAMEFLGAASH